MLCKHMITCHMMGMGIGGRTFANFYEKSMALYVRELATLVARATALNDIHHDLARSDPAQTQVAEENCKTSDMIERINAAVAIPRVI